MKENAASPSEHGALPISVEQAKLGFPVKKRSQEGRNPETMDELYRTNNTRNFHEKLNRSRKGYVPQADMERNLDGNSRRSVTSLKDGSSTTTSTFTTMWHDGMENDLDIRAGDARIPALDLQEVEDETAG